MDLNNKKNRNELKPFFKKNAIPTESNFADLIDGMLNQKEDGIAKLSGTPLSIEADNSSQKNVLSLYTKLADNQPTWTLSLNAPSSQGGLSINDASNTSRLFIGANGNVGIGVNDPIEKLEINGRLKVGKLTLGAWPADPNYIFLGTNIPNQTQLVSYALLQGVTGGDVGRTFLNSSVDVRLRIQNQDKLVIHNNGCIGIGTGDPKASLHIQTVTDIVVGKEEGGGLIIGNSAGSHLAIDNNEIMAKSDGTTAGTLSLQNEGGKVFVGGNVGIGTVSPKASLHIQTAADVTVEKEEGGGLIIGNSSDLHLAMDNNEIMAKKNGTTAGTLSLQPEGGKVFMGGNVGIGISNPTEKLEINGDVKISGSIYQGEWIDAILQHSWINYGGDYNKAGYFKDSFGMVHLRGLVKSGTLGQVIFTLPDGYCPQGRELRVVCTSPNVAGRIDVMTNGQVVAVHGNSEWISLGGIAFRVAPPATGPIHPSLGSLIIDPPMNPISPTKPMTPMTPASQITPAKQKEMDKMGMGKKSPKMK